MEYKAKIQLTPEMINNFFPGVNARRGKANKDSNIKGFIYTYNKYADYFGIDNKLEVCHFLAQVGVESDQFNAYEEYSDGSQYNGRQDLGNIYGGDGQRFKGRGPMQITGRNNYQMIGNEILKLPFLNNAERELFQNNGLLRKPELLKDPVWGTLSAFIFWTQKDLNEYCKPDNVKVTLKRLVNGKWSNYLYEPVEAITRKVNGGVNGLKERKQFYQSISKKIEI